MTEKMEMSLDDIIRSNRGSGNRIQQQTNKRFPATNRAGVRRVGGATNFQYNNPGSRSGSYSYRNGYNAGGAGYITRLSGGIQKPPYFRGGLNNGWRRDFDGPKRIFGAGVNLAINSFANGGGPAALMVSNLDYGVTDTDIRELFSDFGPLTKAAVHYDRSGRSLGTAEVIYERMADAVKAVKQYNGVPLDGRPMNIQFATSELPYSYSKAHVPYFNGTSNYRGFGNRPQSTRGAAGYRRGNSGMRGITRGGGQQRGRGRSEPTAEELDAELDAYVNKMQ